MNATDMMRQAGIALAYALNNVKLSDEEAWETKNIHKKWIVGEKVEPGYIRMYNDLLYRVKEGQGHTTQADWTPDKTPAMWEVIDEEHAGTQEDLIPWNKNMQCYEGKYYTENGQLYKCTRDSGITLDYNISDLIGTYFEKVV